MKIETRLRAGEETDQGGDDTSQGGAGGAGTPPGG